MSIPAMGFIFIAVGALLVGLTVWLARRKHRSGWLWGVAAAFGLILALIALAFFGDLASMTAEQSKKSMARERIVCGILIALGILRVIGRVIRAR